MEGPIKERIVFDDELRNAVKNTVTILARAVKSTLGPSGTNVGVLSPIKLPDVVNDGVTVARGVVFIDPLSDYISKILKTVCDSMEKDAGDGTTTAMTLAEAIILKGIQLIQANLSAVDVIKGITVATEMVLEELKDKSTTVEGNDDLLLQVASISANNDPVIGRIISDAFLQVGVHGQIQTDDSHTRETFVEVRDGMNYLSGFGSHMFATIPREAVLENCEIMIYEGKIKSIHPFLPVLEDLKNRNSSLLIIADDFTEEAMNDLVTNKLQNDLKVCAVRSPGYGVDKDNNLDDIAAVTGTQIISRRFGLEIENMIPEFLGDSTKVRVNAQTFSIICEDADQEVINERIAEITEQVKTATKTEKRELNDRLARLTNGVAVVYVGADSDTELVERKYRIEDAINSTRSALEEGVVPGGGVTLLKLSHSLVMPKLDNLAQEKGFEAIVEALRAPILTICENSGVSGEVVASKVLEGDFNFGYNARTNKYGDLIEEGVIDPKKVTRNALKNASSLAKMVLSMNCAVY